MDRIVSALTCPHNPPGFTFKHTPGHGYQAGCRSCMCTGAEYPIASVAMANFEKAVSKARAAERREIKRQKGVYM